MQLDVEVGNYSPTARKVTVEVALGNSTWRLTGTCPPGRSTTLSEEIGVRKPGWQSGEARLVGVDDALAADNVCPFVLQVRPQPTYVLMTRQAKGRKATSSLFLECALAPTVAKGRQRRNDQSPVGRSHRSGLVRSRRAGRRRLDPVGSSRQALRRDGQAAGGAAASRPADPVRGRELVDATNLKRLCEVAGSGLQMPVEFTPPPAGQVRRDLFLTSVRRDSPPFARLRRQPDVDDRPAAFRRRAELAAARNGRGRRRAGRATTTARPASCSVRPTPARWR